MKSVAFAAGLCVSELGFGAAEIGNLHRALSDDEARATLLAATQSGVTLFDTAPFYGHGLSKIRLGRYLRGLPRGGYVISTKIGRYLDRPALDAAPSAFAAPLPFSPVFDYSYDGTMRALEQSRERLGLDHIDIVFIHDLDRRNHGDAFDGHYRIAMNGALRALSELRASSDIGAIGVAVNDAATGTAMLAEADFDCALLAGRYTLLDQSALGQFLPEVQARKMGLLAGGIFNSGILATGARAGAVYDYAVAPAEIVQRVRALDAICVRHGVTLAAAAMQFVQAHPAVSALLVGASRPATIGRAVEGLLMPVPAAMWHEMRIAGFWPETVPIPF